MALTSALWACWHHLIQHIGQRAVRHARLRDDRPVQMQDYAVSEGLQLEDKGQTYQHLFLRMNMATMKMTMLTWLQLNSRMIFSI